MKANDLQLQELINFSDGLINLHGRRLILHDTYAMAQFHNDLTSMVGPEQSRRILTRFGFFWGQADAAAMKRVFEWDSLKEWLLAIQHLHSFQGIARTEINSLEFDPNGWIKMDITWNETAESEMHLSEAMSLVHTMDIHRQLRRKTHGRQHSNGRHPATVRGRCRGPAARGRGDGSVLRAV